MAITAEDIEKFEAREAANCFIRSLKMLDASTPRAKGAPSRIERLRDAVAKAMNGEGGGDHDDDGTLSVEIVKSQPTHATKLVFQKGQGKGPLIVEGHDPELAALAGRVLYCRDGRTGDYFAVAECE